MSSLNLCVAIECLLFVSKGPVSATHLAEAVGIVADRIPQVIDQLQRALEGRGLHVVELAGGYHLATRAEHSELIEKFLEPEPERLSIPALETLAIIAYRQPLSRPEIDELRGVNSTGVISTLLEKGLVAIAGRKKAPGRPFLLKTTVHFLASFGLKDIAELPRLDGVEAGHWAAGLAVSSPQQSSEGQEEADSSPRDEVG